MDLLKRSELPAWLVQRFGSARGLADALDTTRQTAHNLITGRTLPNYETCQKLGLEPMFMETRDRGTAEMENLDDFLSKRRQQASAAQAEQARMMILREKGSGMWGGLMEATWLRASRVGNVDGATFSWNSYPFLQLGDVAATFSFGKLPNESKQLFRIVFGRIPTGLYPVEAAPPREVWDVELSVLGDEFVWNIDSAGIVGAETGRVSELVIRKLIEYRDMYQAFYKTNQWLT
jgi:hypothetical protein